jgi:signal transduction histidine kinase
MTRAPPAVLPFSALQVFEWSDTPMWVFDLAGKCMRWANPAGVAFWNAASLEEFLARDFSNLSPATITRNQAQMDEHTAGRTGHDQWTVYPLGQPTTLNAHTIGVQLPDGSLAILYEALQVPNTLTPSVLRGVETMQQTPLIVGLYRLIDGSAVMLNPSGVRAFGILDSSVRCDDFAAIFVDPALAQTIRQQVSDSQIFSAEALIKTCMGERWYGLDVRPVSDPVTGESLLQLNAQDISELKATQADLNLAKEVAEAANLAKSRFLATMSHEIRTPMNGILGMAQLLLMPSLNDSERRDYARTILSSGQTLLSLLNDILDLSKIEAGKFQLDATVVTPESVLRETCNLFGGSAQAKGLQLDCQWRGVIDQRYLADSHRLRQMLFNLVGNAIKFTYQGQVRVEATETDRSGESALLEFAVSDSGIGIPDDKVDFLFKPFSQTDSSTTREFGGTGLGLSIVSQLAKAMGGDVGVSSEPGLGSRFWFRVRVQVVTQGQSSRHAERLDADAQPSTPPGKLSGHVLVAEDNLVNCMVIESLLGKLGITMTLASDGQEAVDAITQIGHGVSADQPNLILMDIQMPVMDGYTATDKIRQWEFTHGHPRLPILALTADAFEDDRQHCLDVGMDDVLTKPISMDALKVALAKWLPAAQQVPTVTPAPAPLKPIDRDAFVALVSELTPLLEQNMFVAISRFSALQSLVAGTVLAGEVEVLAAQLQEMRFDWVLTQLRQMTIYQSP